MSLSADSVADIDAMLADIGEAVTVGAVSHYGLFDQAVDFTFQDGRTEVQERVSTLRVRTGKFPALAKFKLITIAGTQYQVRDFQPEDDGKLTLVIVARTAT